MTDCRKASLEMESPIVNDYKKGFILRRFLETFFGGLKVYFQFPVPFYVYLIQITLFAIIPCSTGTFLHLLNRGSIQMVYGAIANGCILLMYALFVQILALCLQRQKSSKVEMEQVSTFGDEEVIHFDSILGPKTWLFLVPPKQVLCNIFSHSLLVGVIGGLSLYYMHLEPKDFLWNRSLRWAFSISGLTTVSVGIWPLIVGSPPEPGVFNQLPHDLQDLSRPSHLLTFFLIDGIASNYPQSEVLFYVNCFGHVLFSVSPLLWVIGALPPVDAYLLWVLERWLVCFLGGSPTASNTKLTIHFIVGSINLGILCALPSLSALAILSSLSGFLLSLDWAHLVSYARRHRVGTRRMNSTRKGPPPEYLATHNLKREILFYGLFLVGIMSLTLAVYLPHLDWFANAGSAVNPGNRTDVEISTSIGHVPSIFRTSVVDSLWGFSLALCTTMATLHYIQKPYWVVWLKNPLSQKMKKPFLKLFLLISYLIRCGGPFVSFLFIHFLMGANVSRIPFGKQFKSSLGVVISLAFLSRQVWQFPEHSIVSVSVFYAVEKIGGTQLSSSPWGSIAVPSRVHIFCLLMRWLVGTWKRLQTIVSISLTSILEAKQRKLINFILVGINLSLLPVLAALSAVCSVLCIPLFPLFTLPLFLVGFPRPLRFWSYPVGYSANQCPDTVYYEQLAPYVNKALHLRVLCGGLGIPDPGEIYLLRWEDRFLWVEILETGFIHFTYSFKGLELQETSCHTTEASRVDSIFSRAFDKDFSGSSCNPFSLHTLEPKCTIAAVGYSETRNVLTGVIDSPETLDVVRDYFLKTLVYYLLYFSFNNSNNSSPAVSRPMSAVSRLASADVTTRKAFASLPKADRDEGSRVTVYSASEEESSSLRTQSGRGSRLAWVSGSRVAGATTSKRESKVQQTESIREEREAVLRSASWASTEGSDHKPLPYPEDFSSHFGPRERSGEDSKYKVHPSKAKTYVKPLENPAETRKKGQSENSHLKKQFSDSDSDSESTRELFLKSLSRKPLTREKDSLSTVLDARSPDPFKGKRTAESFALKSPVLGPVSFPFRDGESSSSAFPFDLKQGDSQESGSLSLTEELANKPHRKAGAGKGCIPAYKSSLSVALSPRLKWIVNLPYDEETLEDLQDFFPLSWFKFLLKHFGMLEIEEMKALESVAELTVRDERLLEQLLADEFLEESYRTLVALCHIIVLGFDSCSPTTSRVFRTFNGKLPNCKGTEWLAKNENLFDIAIKAYRVAVKLSLDHTLVGPVNNCWSDLQTALEEYSAEWFVGPDMDSQAGSKKDSLGDSWAQNIKRETPSLFSLGYNDAKGIYTSHLLTLGEAEINVGKLNDETVRAFWASLSGELLYLTNDDDERYSIQAHPVLLRNLTIQAADPPLGYPIYSSPPVTLSFT